jgi:hypothetical protein
MTALQATETAQPPRPSFFVAIALLIAVVVIYGFSFTFRENFLHPAYPRPRVLYVHALVFASWLLLFLTQTAFVRARRVDLHRRLGQWGLWLGAAIPPLGVATAIAMTRVRVAHGEVEVAASFLIPCFDMLSFTPAFVLAALWRKRPEFHRRLMLVATAALTAAAWGRMPALDHAEWFYVGVDGLVAMGALRDLIVTGRVHVVYRFALPMLITGQLLLAWVRWSPGWLALAPTLFK